LRGDGGELDEGEKVLRVKASPGAIAGAVDEGYGKLADAFRRNVSSGQEVGAAVAVYRDGVKVVDLWGGYRNGTAAAAAGVVVSPVGHSPCGRRG
jgi:hypothetical protein